MITDNEVREIAAGCYLAQGSPGTSTRGFVLTGAIGDVDELIRELEAGSERVAEADMVALREYIRASGSRPPVAGWLELTIALTNRLRAEQQGG